MAETKEHDAVDEEHAEDGGEVDHRVKYTTGEGRSQGERRGKVKKGWGEKRKISKGRGEK
jgi:hypothetical protein